jgi:metallo-beta-lactamase family protein
MPVKIKFLGGVRTVTGSSHLISTDKAEILLDCGLFQGRREQFYEINTNFTFNPRKLNAMILSHAHVDHCGNIPSLIKKGMRCKIYTTSATKDLAKLMLEDSGKIQEEDIRYLNKINKRMGLPGRSPLYTRKEAARAIKLFRSISYNQRFCVAKDIYVTLIDAGHILGSSIVLLDVGQNGSRPIRIGYAVDLGRKNLPILNDPSVPEGLDYLILESTYGGRLHSPIEEAKKDLKDAINRTIERHGKIIIPAFSLERTQEVLYFLSELLKEQAIPSIPIYVDSPLALDITEMFKYHSSYMNATTRGYIDKGESPFEFLNLKFIRQQYESKALNSERGPMIILAGSGMCESGRVLHHLANNIEDSRNTVLVVGYMAKDTRGKRIVDKEPFVRIFGIEHELNAEVVVINAFSGHADKNELVEFVNNCLPVKRIFLVHGDHEQSQALFETLSATGLDVYLPLTNEEVLLE